ncbi:hypothetical protein FRC17_005295, partial [Serendipita sp. 399]
QAGRAYVLEKSKGLSTLYNFHEQLIGVEDAFRNLVRGIPSPDASRIPSLQAMVSRIIGRHIAEETLRDKKELEEEGIDDCISHWYESMTVPSRKDAIVAHALQLVELKIPVFIIELWSGLLSITVHAGLHKESSILIEYILLYYFTPYDQNKDPCSCPAAATAGREITELYKKFTAQFPPSDFLSILLSILESQPLAVWRIRSLCHLMRHLDADIILTSRMIQSMIISYTFNYLHPKDPKAPPQDTDWYPKYVCSRSSFLLCTLISYSLEFNASDLREMELLSSMIHSLWKWMQKRQLKGSDALVRISIVFDSILLTLLSKTSIMTDRSGILDRLAIHESMVSSDPPQEEVFYDLLGALSYTEQSFASQSGTTLIDTAGGIPSHVHEQCRLFRRHRFTGLADGLEREWKDLDSSGRFPLSWSAEHFETSFSESRKRKRTLTGRQRGRNSKRRKRDSDGEEGLSEDTRQEGSDGSEESDSVTEWNASASEEDSAGEEAIAFEDDDDQFIYIEEKPKSSRIQRAISSSDQDNSEYEEDNVEESSSIFEGSTDDPDVTMNACSGGHGSLDEEADVNVEYEQEDGTEKEDESGGEKEPVGTNGSSKTLRIPNSAWGQYSAPILRSVLAAKLHPSENSRAVAASRAARLVRPSIAKHATYNRYAQYATASSDDELDLLGRETRWSTP